VLREEIVARDDFVAPTGCAQSLTGGLTHAARNRLQKATLGLRVLQRMLETGQAYDAEPTIFKIFNELKTLEEELAPTRGSPFTTPSSGKSCRALIVEDDANERELLAGYLRLSGFAVSTAIDGLQAMAHLSKHDRTDPERTDIVLLDMKMPRFDGRKTISAIRQNADYQTLKIFAVTGSDQAESAVDIGPQGVDRWFRKPVDPEILVDAIHEELAAQVVSI
jgi:CheY-like chemotaxis protein